MKNTKERIKEKKNDFKTIIKNKITISYCIRISFFDCQFLFTKLLLSSYILQFPGRGKSNIF